MGERVFDLSVTADHEILASGHRIRLRAPAAPERLLDAIDAARFREDERMPYWAELWPAAIAFAERILEGGLPLRGRDVLELGSGLGLAGIAAALVGAREVTFSDYFEQALAFSAANATLNGIERFQTLHLDWREPWTPRRYEVVIGSDLLYETRNLVPVLLTLQSALEPAGIAYIADPDRYTASAFTPLASTHGFNVAAIALPRRGAIYCLTRRM